MKIRAFTKNKGWGFLHIYIEKMKYTCHHYTLSYTLEPFTLEFSKTDGCQDKDIRIIFKINK